MGERGEFKIAAVSKYITGEMKDLYILGKVQWLWSGSTILICINFLSGASLQGFVKPSVKNYLSTPLTKGEKQHCYRFWCKSKPAVTQRDYIKDAKQRVFTVLCVFYFCFHL